LRNHIEPHGLQPVYVTLRLGRSNAPMKVKEVIVLDNDTPQSQNLISFLKDNSYTATPMNSFANMDRYMTKTECRAVVLNLDNISVTNKTLRDFKRKKPAINIIAHSKRQFHPELEEALREYISVCLAEPVDTDELSYWLKSVFENSKTMDG
jgi:DNA-binding NtrC family response regulator